MRQLDCRNKGLKPIACEKEPTLWGMTNAFNFYIEELKPLIIENCTQPMDGFHGLETHTNAVVFRGIDYALHLGKEPLPVVFACAFHDMARVNDDAECEHGKNAVPKAIKIMKEFQNKSEFQQILDQQTRISILSAIMNHTTGNIATDYIAACLWDADRTRLAWQYGFEEKFFNTQRGKYVAGHPAHKYIKYQQELFPHLLWNKEY